MKDYVTTNGIILKTANLGEYDKRMVFLTQDHGKITVFGRGVRRQSSKFLAACAPFSFGTLKAFPGKDAYSLLDFNVTKYFEGLRDDFEISCMGMYFLEICDYYARENNDDLLMLKLLYVALLYLEKTAKGEFSDKASFSPEFIRAVFEIKTVCVNGEFPGIPESLNMSEAASYAVGYIEKAPVEKVFSFSVSPQALSMLCDYATFLRRRFITGNFKSLEILESLG